MKKGRKFAAVALSVLMTAAVAAPAGLTAPQTLGEKLGLGAVTVEAAQETVLTAPENPAPHILCAHSRMIQTVILHQNSLDIQAADLCYQLLDDLEPWLEVPCKMESARLKCVIMDVCGNLLEKFDEPDTAALCYEYGIRFAVETGDENSAEDMRESLQKIK